MTIATRRHSQFENDPFPAGPMFLEERPQFLGASTAIADNNAVAFADTMDRCFSVFSLLLDRRPILELEFWMCDTSGMSQTESASSLGMRGVDCRHMAISINYDSCERLRHTRTQRNSHMAHSVRLIVPRAEPSRQASKL